MAGNRITLHLSGTSQDHGDVRFEVFIKELGYVKNIKASVAQTIENSSGRRDLASTNVVTLVDGVPVGPGRL